MRGVSSLETLCETAHAQGADTLALTDTNGLYGAIRFLEVARQHKLRPILGAELTDRDRGASVAARSRPSGVQTDAPLVHFTRLPQASLHPLLHPPHPQARQGAPSSRGP
ncbi:MAG: PHP domain-containing protein, partial [Nitrospiraceae bacterium]